MSKYSYWFITISWLHLPMNWITVCYYIRSVGCEINHFLCHVDYRLDGSWSCYSLGQTARHTSCPHWVIMLWFSLLYFDLSVICHCKFVGHMHKGYVCCRPNAQKLLTLYVVRKVMATSFTRDCDHWVSVNLTSAVQSLCGAACSSTGCCTLALGRCANHFKRKLDIE